MIFDFSTHLKVSALTKGVLEKQVVLLLFHSILHPANYQTALSALILQLSKVNTKQYKPLALLKVNQRVISFPRCCRQTVMHGGSRASIKIQICHLNHSMNVPYLHFRHLIYSNSGRGGGGGWGLSPLSHRNVNSGAVID